MAAGAPSGLVSLNHANGRDENQIKVMTQNDDDDDDGNNIDYVQRGQWLRAAVLGAIDGLVSVASLMMGVGAVKQDVKAMLLAGFAGSVAGASAMAIGEFVSVGTQYDVEVGQRNRDNMNMMGEMGGRRRDDEKDMEMGMEKMRSLPSPIQAATASAFSYAVGAVIPMLSAAFVTDYRIRLIVVVAVASLALLGFGCLGAKLGRTPKVRSSLRVLVGGWSAMAVTFGLTKWLGTSSSLK